MGEGESFASSEGRVGAVRIGSDPPPPPLFQNGSGGTHCDPKKDVRREGGLETHNEAPGFLSAAAKHIISIIINSNTTSAIARTTTISSRLFALIRSRVIHAFPKPWIPALFVFDRTLL
eukprot:9006126-Pyramimonas_sp.AAC.1